MYKYSDAEKYARKVFKEDSALEILKFIANDSWELSQDKIHVQRLNHKALINLALEKLDEY